MAFCTNSNWTIDLFKDPADILTMPSTSIGRLFFELTITNGVITGEVFSLGSKLSDVTGTCREIAALNIAVMELNFTWVAHVVLVGIVFTQGSLTRFRGRFCGLSPISVTPTEVLRQTLLAVDVGDTGTGNGTQT
jgi:hypothetical protein